jgi:hypothetical protein
VAEALYLLPGRDRHLGAGKYEPAVYLSSSDDEDEDADGEDKAQSP